MIRFYNGYILSFAGGMSLKAARSGPTAIPSSMWAIKRPKCPPLTGR